MKETVQFSTSWIPHVVSFSNQTYYTQLGTGNVVLEGSVPRAFKISDIVAADTISSPDDGANLTDLHRAILVTGRVPSDQVMLPVRADAKADIASAEAAFFKNLGIDLNASDPDPVLMLLVRLFFLDKSPSVMPPLPQRPPCLPRPPETLLQKGPEGFLAREKYAHDILYLQIPCKIATLPRPAPPVFEKQSYETNSLLLSFKGITFELADGLPLEPMFCSAVLVSRAGDGEFLSQTFHFDAVDAELLHQSSGGRARFNMLTRHKDVLLQLSSLPDTTSVWLVVIVEKSMGFHTQKPYLEKGAGNIEDLKQRLANNCTLYGKYRRPFVWGYTELYSRFAGALGWNNMVPVDDVDLAAQLSGLSTAGGLPSAQMWQMGNFEIPHLYLVSEFCDHFNKPFSIFESMNRVDSKRSKHTRVNGSLHFVLQPWSGADFSSPGPHCITSIAHSKGSEGRILNCFLHRPSISLKQEVPADGQEVVFAAHEPSLHSHMRCLRCYDELFNSLYVTDLSVSLQDVKIKKNFGERDNYVLRICFKESDHGEDDGVVPAMVMKSSSEAALATEAFTHVVMDVSNPHFLDEIRVELRAQLHANSHLLITLMRVARRSKVSTLFKVAPSKDELMPDVIVGHAVLKFSNTKELATCCTKPSSLQLIEHPLKPGYLKPENNSYLAGGQRVVLCQLRLQSSVLPSTPLMEGMFSALRSFHELSGELHQFITRGSGLSLSCAHRDLETEIRSISAALLQLTTTVDVLEVMAFFPAIATFMVHVICSSHHFYLYEKSREDSFAQAQPLAVLCSQLSRQSLLSLMYFVNAIASRNAEFKIKKMQMTSSTTPAFFDGSRAATSKRNVGSDGIDADDCPAPNILWFAHRVFDDGATFASTGRSSSVLLAEVWSRSLQDQIHDVNTSSPILSPRSAPIRPSAGKVAPIKDSPPLNFQDIAKLNKDSTCSIAWFMFPLIRKGMLLHLQRNGLECDGFAPNSSHPLRKMLVEFSLEIINTLTSFLLVSFVDDWPGMDDHDAITTRCFKHMVLFIRDCGPLFGSAFVVTSMKSILLKIKQHTDPDPRIIFTFKAQIHLLEILYNTPHFLILNRLATLDVATPLDPFVLMCHCAHFALLCSFVSQLQNSPFEESNYRISFQLAWDVLLRLDSMEHLVDRFLRQKIALLFWPLLCSMLSLYHQNVDFTTIWTQTFRTKLFTMCLFIVANVPRSNLMTWLEQQTDICLIAFIDLLKDIFAIVAPVYQIQKDTGQDSNAMLVSALSILSYVVLSPELGSERDSMQQRTTKHEQRKKLPVQEVEEVVSVSRDASEGSLWSLLNVLGSVLDVIALRHPSKRATSPRDGGAFSSWEPLKNRCFRAIKSCTLRFDLLVASSDSVPLQFVKSILEDKNSPLFCLSPARMYYIDALKKYVSLVGLNEDEWRELFLLNLQNFCSAEPDFVEFGGLYHRLLSDNIPSPLQIQPVEFRYQPVALHKAESLVLDPDSKALVSIHAASVDALISVLLTRSHPANTPIFKTFFFMWYCLKPLKISAQQLLRCLVSELETAFSEQKSNDVIHIVGLFLKWLEDYVEDFSADLLSNLVDLCNKWRPSFISLCSFDFSNQILFQLYRKLAGVLKDLKRAIDSRHFCPREPEKADEEDAEEAVQNEPADASRLLAMALAVAVSETPKAAAAQGDDDVSKAMATLEREPTSSDISEATNAIDQAGLCTCILMELGSEEIANILTKIFFDTFCNIPPRDFARKALGESSGQFPKYTEATKNSERLSHWIRCMVLMEGRLDYRRKLCSLFVDVCFCFLQRNDFNGLAAVYTGGLSSAAIYRLKKTTGIFTYKDDERVPRDDFESIFEPALAEKYETVKLAMSTDKNFTSYRQRLEKADLPCFPYMGLFVTDATFAWDGKGEKPMKFPAGCIDIRRAIKVAGIVIGNLMLYQKHQYSFEVNPEAEKKLRATFKAPLLKKLEQLNEKNANSYDDFCILLSKNIEPEERKQAVAADVPVQPSLQTAASIGRPGPASSSASPAAPAAAYNPKTPRPTGAPSVSAPNAPVSLAPMAAAASSATFAASAASPPTSAAGGAAAAPSIVDNVASLSSGDTGLAAKQAHDT